jgi:hypothetical protein
MSQSGIDNPNSAALLMRLTEGFERLDLRERLIILLCHFP